MRILCCIVVDIFHFSLPHFTTIVFLVVTAAHSIEGKYVYSSESQQTLAEMAENVLTLEFPLTNFKTKKARETVLTEIKKNVCALLNTNGGKLVLTGIDATADNKIYNVVIRPIEQCFTSIIGINEVRNRFQVLEETFNTITFGIQALPILCTLNTYLFTPTYTEISQISCIKDQDALRDVMFERRIVEALQHDVPEEFSFNRDCGFHESKTVQFKLLKAEKSKQTSFANRVINNNFTNIISSFANAAGGSIFYGIKDDGIVKGEVLSDSEELRKTTEKLEKAAGEMIWQDKSREVERGREWDIKFVPVKNDNNETIPSTFVMVVTVNPYIGGVFTKEPESYYLEDSEVKRMPFDIWRQNTYYKAATPVKELERSSWSSESNRIVYMKITQKLRNLRQLGEWNQIGEIAKALIMRNDLQVNTKLICLFQVAVVYYRQGNFTKAEHFINKFRKYMCSAEDKSVFAVAERCCASGMERSRGNYQEAWEIIEEGLKLARHAPAGFLPAGAYATAALILSSLVDEESLKNDKDFESKTHELIEMAKSFCHQALQHLLYIEDEFEIIKEDLKQRINTTLASLHLKLPDPKYSLFSRPSKEIAKAMRHIGVSEDSLANLQGTKRLTYNSCRQSLVKSDLYFRKYQLEPTDARIEHLKEALKCVEEARGPANDNNFEDMKMLCEELTQKIEVQFQKVENDRETCLHRPLEMVIENLLDHRNPNKYF